MRTYEPSFLEATLLPRFGHDAGRENISIACGTIPDIIMILIQKYESRIE